MATGGDFIEVRVSHPVLGDHVFEPKSNEGNTFDLGGARTSDDANAITGAGNPIWQLNMTRGFFEVVVANDANTKNDAQFAADLSAHPEPGEWTFTHINGVVWGMTGKPVGDIQPDTNAATFTLKVSGGKPVKIVG
jgi:hypothetical protein